jgi:hypothetical protein
MEQASYPLDTADPKMIPDIVKREKFRKSPAKNQTTVAQSTLTLISVNQNYMLNTYYTITLYY